MTAAVIIQQVRDRGGTLAADGGSLVVRVPVPPPEDLVQQVRAHKEDILAVLQLVAPVWAACHAAGMPEDDAYVHDVIRRARMAAAPDEDSEAERLAIQAEAEMT